MTTTCDHPTCNTPNTRRLAYNAGRAKAQSLNPGHPRQDAATYPTAMERQGYIDGWYSTR